MEKRISDLVQNIDVRANLSGLRQEIKENENRIWLQNRIEEDVAFWTSFLSSDDAKTRKNIALLLGDVKCQKAMSQIFESYNKETTLFVKSAYLTALLELEVESILPELKQRMEELENEEITEENRKHIEEEKRELRKILIRQEGIKKHKFSPRGKDVEALLLVNRNQKETVKRTITCGKAKVHPLGVLVETDDLPSLMQVRTYREMLFQIHTKGFISAKPEDAAKEIWNADLWEILTKLHKENDPFYFRLECKSPMTLEERSKFSNKFCASLERISEGKLINSTTDYEIEIRLIANKEGKFYPCLKLNTMRNQRFAYRKNAISASIHPSTAALIMEIAESYLKEGAQIMDPFCGVGTMLIERDKKVTAREIYATDIFGDAIEMGRENAKLAGTHINFIHRDFFDFKHAYKFDEIVTNMPVRGKKSKEEMNQLYAKFFDKANEILTPDGVIIMYTNEMGLVKKYLRLHKEFSLLQETCMQTKTEFYLLILGKKGK